MDDTRVENRPLYAAAYLLAMYGAIGGNSVARNVLQLPVFVQELVLAVWMIARGFRPVVPEPVSGAQAARVRTVRPKPQPVK